MHHEGKKEINEQNRSYQRHIEFRTIRSNCRLDPTQFKPGNNFKRRNLQNALYRETVISKNRSNAWEMNKSLL